MSQVNERLDQIDPENPRQHALKSQAIEEIDLFQKTTLFEMRTIFE